jgi:hypothetical protein
MNNELYNQRLDLLRKSICEHQDTVKRKQSDIDCYKDNVKELGGLLRELVDNSDFFINSIESNNPHTGLEFDEWQKRARKLLFILEL